ncbi:hypothetical protein PVL29_007246 [Vitis rotundifolia]|uniref:ABC transporter family G domain-containing protein n=1 Tax=Vitis rotundifolia TaxID=103349 RepID=A0AA39A022_VITRO|nr:hypothetical protein PVL29_007246 [Vitis rotundifolia]
MRVKWDSSLGEACCQCSEGNATSGGKFDFMGQNGILHWGIMIHTWCGMAPLLFGFLLGLGPSTSYWVGKQRLQEARIQTVDYLILLLAGICLGTLAKVSNATFGALGYNYTVIAVSLLFKIGALRSFSQGKLHYWRERASGMSSLAYFLSKDTVDHLNTIIKPLVYLSMFYFFNNPRSSFPDNYFILLSGVLRDWYSLLICHRF